MKILYIAETSLTNKSAYSQHVIKMCDAFIKLGHKTSLITSKKNLNLNINKMKKDFALKGKSPFKVLSFSNLNSNNFISRILFGIRTVFFLKKQKKIDLILTRSVITSFILSLFKIHHFLEIHSELKSFTKIIMINFNFINSKYIIKKILISKALNKIFRFSKNEILILHDGVDTDNFYKSIKINRIRNATYVGSFYRGRGVEIIIELAKKFKKVKFNLYGNINKNFKSKLKNIYINNFLPYGKIPSILSKSDVLLMPYSNFVSVRSKNLNTANYCSPLKMFDYLASGRIIMSSKLDGICEVLKHKKNAIIVDNYNIKNWMHSFNNIYKKKYPINKIQKNALLTAKNFTWNKRALKIIQANKKIKEK
jgi:glycosyltransferase involved in cell wall biosynthesis